MKKFLALVLALLMALSCFSFAGAEGETVPCTNHDFTNVKPTVKKAATCTEDGLEVWKCNRCHNEVEKIVKATGHQGGTVKMIVAATCTTPELTTFVGCSVCKDEKVEYTVETKPMLGHDYKDVKDGKKTPATCTAAATKEVECTRCKDRQMVVDPSVNEGKPLGHDYSENSVTSTKAPTCTEAGYEGEAYYCKNGCGAYNPDKPYTLKELPALTHTKDDAQFAEFIAYFFDKNEKGEYVVKPGHTYKDGKQVLTGVYPHSDVYGKKKGVEVDYKSATCTEAGHMIVTCLDCGKSWTAVIPAIKHNFTAAIVHVYCAWEEDTFDYKFTDLVDGKVTAEQWKKVLEDGIDDHEPFDCTKPVAVTYICGNCGEEVEGASLTLEHDFSYIVHYTQQKYGELKPTDYDDIDDIAVCQPYTITYECRYCVQQKTVDGKVEKHNLDLDNKIVYEEPTCTKEGTALVKCKNANCSYTELRTLPKDKHHADEKKTEIVAATCTKAGTRTFTCKDCGYKWSEVIPALGHDWKTTVKEGTCTKPTVTTKTCMYCGETETITGELGHVVASDADVKTQYNVTFTKKTVPGGFIPENIKWTDCAKEGRLQYYCSKCCTLITVENKAGSEHNWKLDTTTYANGTMYEGFGAGYTAAAPVKVDDANCKVVITGHYYCTKCAQTEERKTEIKIKHEATTTEPLYVETGKEATCKNPGEGYFQCKHCNALYKAVVDTKNHNYVTTWDVAKKAWVYTCSLCGDTKTMEFTAEKYNIDLSKVTYGARTEGTGKVTLKDSLVPTSIFGTRYAYIRWTWTGANNSKWVSEDTRVIAADGTFDMKGMKAPAGTTLTEVLVIVTGEKNADSMQLGDFSNYGYVIK